MDLNPCQSVSLLLLLEYKQSFKFGGVDNCQKYLIETCGFRPLSHPFSYLGLCLCPFLFKFLICSLFSLTCHFARSHMLIDGLFYRILNWIELHF